MMGIEKVDVHPYLPTPLVGRQNARSAKVSFVHLLFTVGTFKIRLLSETLHADGSQVAQCEPTNECSAKI